MPLGKLPYLYNSLDLENGGSNRAGFSFWQFIPLLSSNNKVWPSLFSSLWGGVEQPIHKLDEDMGH